MLTLILGTLLLAVLALVATSDPGLPGSGTMVPVPVPARARRR